MLFCNGIKPADLDLAKIKVKFNMGKVQDIKNEINMEFDRKGLGNKIKPEMSIGVTAGSRGIDNIDLILRYVCQYLEGRGAKPFIIPAMGSHGGATSKGQVAVLKKLKISPETMGVPIKSSMDVVKIGETDNNSPVYIDQYAHGADGIVVVNRVKPHTDFIAGIESGLMKMMAVGLGKAKGCAAMHLHGLGETIPKAARIIIDKAPILIGLAILENSRDETYRIEAINPEDIEKRERELLIESKENVPKLPMEYLDVLIIEEIGKMYSGTGMDTKVIGRMKIFGEIEPQKPSIRKIVALNLAKSSAGNALGIGLADLTTKKLVDSIDYGATYANTIATTFLERAKVPVTVKDDKEAIEVAVNTVGPVTEESIKLAIIRNTLELEELYVTQAVLDEMDTEKIEVINENVRMKFDSIGNLNYEE